MHLNLNKRRTWLLAAILTMAVPVMMNACSRDKKTAEPVLEQESTQTAQAGSTEKKGEDLKGPASGKPGLPDDPKAVAARHRTGPEPAGAINRNAERVTGKRKIPTPPGITGEKAAGGGVKTTTGSNEAVSDSTPPPSKPGEQPANDRPGVRKDPSRPPLPDPRLLLTLVDVASAAPAKTRFKRVALTGFERTDDNDSILYLPEKGNSFGFSLQIFRSRNALDTKRRFESLQASYPASQEIPPVSGKTFFSYWKEILHIGFVHPTKNLVVIISCGRKYCDSDKLMVLAGKVAERLR